MKRVLYPLLLVVAISTVAGLLGQDAAGWWPLAVAISYAAIATFLFGLIWRIVSWSNVPVPFRIPTVCGQQKSLAWIPSSRLESPSTTLGVIGRMALEILLFRSLFRNYRTKLHPKLEGDPRLVAEENKYLWLGAIAFHWSLLVILLRHLRLFVNPVPRWVLAIQNLDGFFQIGAPVLYATDVVVIAALLYLLQRRLRDPLVRYISLFTDYFALFLLLGIVCSGCAMRYHARVDVTAIKQFAIGLATFSPIALPPLSTWFFIHLVLVATLAAHLPFSKLMHMGGVFLSPTRNLANDNRMRRHINPWDYPVPVHTYEEWETEFHDKIAAAGLPLEKP